MYSKRLGFALATIVAIALSAVAHASPVNLEQTQLVMVVGDQADRVEVDAAPTVEYLIQAYTADIELLVTHINSEVLQVKRRTNSVFEPTIAGVALQPVTDEVGWRH